MVQKAGLDGIRELRCQGQRGAFQCDKIEDHKGPHMVKPVKGLLFKHSGMYWWDYNTTLTTWPEEWF